MELDPDQDANRHQQPGGEQDVHSEAEDGQGHDGKKDEGDDRGHGDRSPFMSQRGADVSRLTPPIARVDPDQPWFVPEGIPDGIRAEPDPMGSRTPAAGAELELSVVCREVVVSAPASPKAQVTRDLITLPGEYE